MKRRIVDFIENRLNIKLNRNSGVLYLSSALSIMFMGYANPCIVKEIVSNLPAQYLAIESLSFCTSTLLIGMLWKGKTREVALRNFAVLATLETIASVVLGIWLLFIDYNVWVMAIASIVYINCISVFINKCVMTFKSKLFLEKAREDFDNGYTSVSSIASIVGLSCSALFMPSLEVGIAVWSLACIFDDIGWMISYHNNKTSLLQCDSLQSK